MSTVTIAEAARRLGVSPDTIRSRIRSGELRSGRAATPRRFSLGVILEDDPLVEAGTPDAESQGEVATIAPAQEAQQPAPKISENGPVLPYSAAQQITPSSDSQPPTLPVAPPETVVPPAPQAFGDGGSTRQASPSTPYMEAPEREPSNGSPARFIPPSVPHVIGNGSPMRPEKPPDKASYFQAQHQGSTNGGGTMVAERAPGENLKLHLQYTDAAPRTKSRRGTALRDLVEALQGQIKDQKAELQARRQEIGELHTMIHQLHAWALGSSPPALGRVSWWQRILRKR